MIPSNFSNDLTIGQDGQCLLKSFYPELNDYNVNHQGDLLYGLKKIEVKLSIYSHITTP